MLVNSQCWESLSKIQTRPTPSWICKYSSSTAIGTPLFSIKIVISVTKQNSLGGLRQKKSFRNASWRLNRRIFCASWRYMLSWPLLWNSFRSSQILSSWCSKDWRQILPIMMNQVGQGLNWKKVLQRKNPKLSKVQINDVDFKFDQFNHKNYYF